MHANRMTRRQALAVGLGSVIAGRLAAAQAPKAEPKQSWVGETILPRVREVVAHFPDSNGLPNPDTASATLGRVLEGASYGVKAEMGSQVQVVEVDGYAGWVERPVDPSPRCSRFLLDEDQDRPEGHLRTPVPRLGVLPARHARQGGEGLRRIPEVASRWSGLALRKTRSGGRAAGQPRCSCWPSRASSRRH